MLLLYTHNITPRLQYIVDFFSKELFDEPIIITTDVERFIDYEGPKLNYSKNDFSSKEFFVSPATLLFENDIKKQSIECFEINFHKAFFQTTGDFSFDIFAASFYLLSRYEEYLPHEKDMYGRFAHNGSLAHLEGFLHLPIVNIWLEDLKKALLHKFPELTFRRKNFKCLVTYDIDMMYSYLYKGFWRNAGGFLKSMVNREWSMVKDRWLVMMHQKKDPFDCFEWLDALHLYCRIKPTYFFLVAKKQKEYDKNIPTHVKAFRDLIEYYATTYKIGIHPSWQSGNGPGLLKEELEWLEVVTGKPIKHSRQHYIRLYLPQTYRQLLETSIEKDYSMGYGSINGFRASVCSSFYWYDLPREKTTPLQLYPFCFMDANSLFEQKYSPQQAYQELMQYYDRVKKLNGVLITVWHNFILGTGISTKGWKEMFELFMKDTVYWDAYYDEG